MKFKLTPTAKFALALALSGAMIGFYAADIFIAYHKYVKAVTK